MKNEAAYPDRLIEWLFASMMLIWGLWLLLPFETFALPQYALLRMIADETVWGAWSMSIALLRLTALWINGSWRRTPAIRCGCSIAGVAWWLTMLYCLFASGDPVIPAGAPWYTLFAIFEAISCWRSAADGFHSRAFRLARSPR